MTKLKTGHQKESKDFTEHWRMKSEAQKQIYSWCREETVNKEAKDGR